MYQALYRKWRPKIFEDVLGQSHITDTLKNQIKSGKLSHAYLFSGTRGTGKTSSAKILARAVNCESPVNGNPCNECYACKTSLSGGAVDIIEMDAASNNKVEDARMIRDEVIYTPAEFKYKVYIIDEAHMLTQSAFNALLKTLEEPPSHIIFIFATTEPHKFPATILSRCQRFDFKRITPVDIAKRIKQIMEAEGCVITDSAVNLVVRAADGSMRDALSLLDQCVALGGKSIEVGDVAEIAGVSDPKFITDFAKSIINGETAEAMLAVKRAYEKGFELSSAADELLSCFRSIMIIKSIPDKKSALSVLELSEEEAKDYFTLSEGISCERVIRYIRALEEAMNSKMFSVNPRLSLEAAVAGMSVKPDINEPQGILEKLAELENRLRNIESGRTPVSVSVKAEKNSGEAEATEKIEVAENIPENIPENTEEISEITKKTEKIELPPIEEIFSDAKAEEDEPYVYNEEDDEPYVYNEEESYDYPLKEEKFDPAEESIEQKNEETAQKAEEPVLSSSDGELSEMWGDVLVLASKSSLVGFDKIMSEAKTEFYDSGVEIFFTNEGFLKIAQMNRFDVNIHEAFKTICKKDIFVRMKTGTPSNTEKDNFSLLMEKVRESGAAEFI